MMEQESISTVCPLRPYQIEVLKAVTDSIFEKKGLTFCVEIARQGGKNELSAQMEAVLLTLYAKRYLNLIKCSPTFKPQCLVSMERLKDRLNDVGFEGDWSTEREYIIRLGNCRAIFLSAAESANVVGHTAHILLEVDESQDVSKDKYAKDFRPMGSTTNVTTVLYGTTWDDSTLLEETKQTAIELEKKDGIKRCFRYDWQEVIKYNPDYLSYVESERERLGENHPLFRTQYCLKPVNGNSRLFSLLQRLQLQGTHGRRRIPESGKTYIAGIDLAGEAEDPESGRLSGRSRRDATVMTIGELDFSSNDAIQKQPVIRVVEHYCWTGEKHTTLYAKMIDILKDIWNCRRIAVDSTGVGQPVASFLRQSLGSRVVPFHFSAHSKSLLGFSLMALVDSGRLKMYSGDNSIEYREFWNEIEKARIVYRPNQTINFFVDPSDGHDDYLMSLALLTEAGEGYSLRSAKGRTQGIT